MDAQRWERLEALFEAATALPVERRDAFCMRECAGDADLLAELRSLLAADQATRSPLDTPPSLSDRAAEPADVLPAGTRIGAWQLGTLIGRGGAGDVYEATRADGAFEQRVALKLLQREAARELGRFGKGGPPTRWIRCAVRWRCARNCCGPTAGKSRRRVPASAKR